MSTVQLIDCHGEMVILLHDTTDSPEGGARMLIQTGSDGMSLEWYEHDHDGPATKHLTLTFDEWRQLIMAVGDSGYLV